MVTFIMVKHAPAVLHSRPLEVHATAVCRYGFGSGYLVAFLIKSERLNSTVSFKTSLFGALLPLSVAQGSWVCSRLKSEE
ncbi:hypothetical protein Tco_1364538, partial [Tanacetum coccineum]